MTGAAGAPGAGSAASAGSAGSDGFRVDPDRLATRAEAVDRLAERLRRATAAASPVEPASYGVVGRAFAGPASTACASASDAITGLAAAVERAADGLRACRADYLSADRACADRLTGLS